MEKALGWRSELGAIKNGNVVIKELPEIRNTLKTCVYYYLG